MAILEGVRPLRMIPPKETTPSGSNVSDCDSPKGMVSPGNSTNWLPPGWIVINRIKRRSTGVNTKYKVYKGPDTDRVFYSRREVLEYLQNGNSYSHRPPQKRTRVEGTPAERPNWLPPDWSVEIKMKRSGRTAGKRYKVFVEGSTDRKFYSVREALDYLKASDSMSAEIKNVKNVRSDDYPNWLPSGWTVQTETESGDTTAERKDKVYVHSITGMKFYTQKEVFDYLNNASSSCTENRKNAEPVSNFGDRTDQFRDTEKEVTKVRGLPPEWFKAIRFRETREGTRKKVSLFVDPKSGYAFFSTKDALRYIDSGHINDCCVKPVLWNDISQNTPGNKFHSVRSDDYPNWLPSGWSVQTEIDRGDRTAEAKKVYVDSITGMKFYTQKEMFDYLNNASSFSTENGKNAEPVSNFGDLTYQFRDTKREVTKVEGLPPEWFKAIRYRQTREEGIRKRVSLYVDPKSGYAFFSTKDALRYIDNGHIKACCIKPILWHDISKNTPGNKYYSHPTGEERELKPGERKVKNPSTEENYRMKSEEDIIEIVDSDEDSAEKPKERKEKKPLFTEENCENKSENVTGTDDPPTEKTGAAEKEKKKVPDTPPPLKRTRFKVLASKSRPVHRPSISISAEAPTSKPSSVCPIQTKVQNNGGDSESKQKKEIPAEGSSKPVESQTSDGASNKASFFSHVGESSLDSCLEFAFKTLTEDSLILDNKKEIQGHFDK